jgi:hypothetical protein
MLERSRGGSCPLRCVKLEEPVINGEAASDFDLRRSGKPLLLDGELQLGESVGLVLCKL